MTDIAAARPRLVIDEGGTDFAALRGEDGYYVDKTGQLPLLLRGRGPLLITRPRRFGKTLTLDTLRRFLELDYRNPGDTAAQQRLFAGLQIMEDPELQEYRERCMGQYPVISISLNTVEGTTWAGAMQRLCTAIDTEFTRHADAIRDLLRDGPIEQDKLDRYTEILAGEDERRQIKILPDILPALISWLHRIYSRPVYILIDEYDTPLNKAWSNEQHPLSGQDPRETAGFYERMTALMRGLLHPLLKPQPAAAQSIARCLLTGCLQISRESIFTGANNLSVLGLRQRRGAELMGFSEQEVEDMLRCFGLSEHLREVQQWYDGYTIGGIDHIYNPWSVVKYCQDTPAAPDPTPQPYWVNTSGNEVLAVLAEELSADGLRELQELLAGGSVQLQVRDTLTYAALHGQPDDDAFLSLLYHSGYLTGTPVPGTGELRLHIPNREVQCCYAAQLQGYFGIRPRHDRARFTSFITQLAAGAAEQAQLTLTEIFTRHLSLQQMSSGAGAEPDPERRRESHYQLLVHLGLSVLADAQVRFCSMEQPLGEGRCDECFVFTRHPGLGCVLEFKVAEHDSPEALQRAARQALAQIEERRYAEGLLCAADLGVQRVWGCGIACIRKRCVLVMREYRR